MIPMIPMADTLMIAALFGCICYAVYLHRRMRGLKVALEGLRPALDSFSDAVERTEGSVQSLRSVADHISSDARRKTGGWRAGLDATSRSAGAAATVRIPAKQDLIRSFFEDAKRSEA